MNHTIKRALCHHCYNSKGWYNEIATMIASYRQPPIDQTTLDLQKDRPVQTYDELTAITDQMHTDYNESKSADCLVVEIDGSIYFSICKNCLQIVQNNILQSALGWTIAPVIKDVCKMCRNENRWEQMATDLFISIAQRNPKSRTCIEEASKARDDFWMSMQAPCLSVRYKASTPFAACSKHIQIILDQFPA